jgi:hypothetical protein
MSSSVCLSSGDVIVSGSSLRPVALCRLRRLQPLDAVADQVPDVGTLYIPSIQQITGAAAPC